MTAVVADELELVVAGIASMFEARGVETIARAKDVRTAVRLVRQHRPDVFVLGTTPDNDAAERAIGAVKRAVPPCIVVALVSGAHAADLGLVLAAGTDALLPRSIDLATLDDMLDRALKGERVIGPSLVPSLLERRTPSVAPRTGLLTIRERDVFEKIARGQTNRQIAEELFVGIETVKSHCANIYDKLDAKNRHDAVARGLAHGLLG